MGSYETPSWASGSWSAERPETIEACVQMLADVRHDGGRVWPMGGGRHSRRPPANDVTVLDTRGMDAIRRLDREALVVTVEAGVTVGALAAYVARRGASVCGWRREHPEATVGGLLSAWQPVPHALWNGSVREACLGLGAVTGAGDRYRYLPAPRKASGPDLRFVFIGAEGVYGVVTTATLAVSPPPAARVAWEATDLEPTQALELASRCARTGLRAANVLYSGQTRTMRWCFEGSAAVVSHWTAILKAHAQVHEIELEGYYNPSAGDIRAGADPVAERPNDTSGGVAVWGDLGADGLAGLPDVCWEHGVLYDLSAHHAALWLPASKAAHLVEGLEETCQVWWGAQSTGGWPGLAALKTRLDPAGILPNAVMTKERM